jgi:hypothetical protein
MKALRNPIFQTIHQTAAKDDHIGAVIDHCLFNPAHYGTQ